MEKDKDVIKDITNLIKKYPNDYELGKKIREMFSSVVKDGENNEHRK
jgi:hypothetical protein